ncbi:hypothetical protein E3Q22_03068 [Wallemia mellicola]|uniref:Uncharacterized protein n=2 Tax=Wallemia mellicola TaxID=1708541 RepID=A0A4T0LPT7_9BASI|nr:hypothetical protein WALSEDRAFT_69725 [Wallemia mellicola CBS 633.66]TIB71895.1 hypothetical protein E3Q24_02032 [Wallemia mellicola]EIM20573.1 hypothetical protein WALSEDRAFT_69725 [Wallemia mellicola CBS 633.66]TIB76640.1 hypothetical protein E3Q23_01745 [Wallemia mellicola]TIB77433.1 hypothetical protein E3Q22_03068 [Wallemia mellicola]TIB85250.1 hypothetical protein E3Q21_02065 [Wallemia mellicola]|eukprot:XP_006959365.1 hypothetical protein WALSEDRAFT_69725 [Wallemia mellicola CBS 633.66]
MLVGDYGSSDEEDERVEQTNSGTKATLFSALPEPRTKEKKKAPVQIRSDSVKSSKQEEDDDVAALVGESSKKSVSETPKTGGNGLSGLLGILPQPKQQQQQQQQHQSKHLDKNTDVEESTSSSSRSNKRSAPIDIFSLGASSSKKLHKEEKQPQSTFSTSVAPELPEYTPPDPSPYDPYPGYYQMPTGEWQAYDSAFYKSKVRQWQIESGVDVEAAEEEERKRKLGLSGKDVVDVSAKDIQKQVRPTQIGPEKPEQPIEVKGPQGRGARARGQLSSLISEAVNNRTELEEKIAQGKANRGTSSKVYGF